MLSQWLWIHVCYTEPNSWELCCVILSRLCFSYGVSCRAIGYEWYEPMVVNYDVLWWASDCESWCVMLSKWLESWWVMLNQWLWVMVRNAEPVVVNHGVLCWASGCESRGFMLSQWLWIMLWYAESVVVNHCVICWISGLWVMLHYADPVVVNHG